MWPADLAVSSNPNDDNYGIQDGDGEDLFRYLDLFAAGC